MTWDIRLSERERERWWAQGNFEWLKKNREHRTENRDLDTRSFREKKLLRIQTRRSPEGWIETREREQEEERSKPKKKGERVRAALLSHLAHTHTRTVVVGLRRVELENLNTRRKSTDWKWQSKATDHGFSTHWIAALNYVILLRETHPTPVDQIIRSDLKQPRDY